MKKSHYSFTLIELLIVVAIIGILASTIIISLTGAMARARDARKKADLAAIYKAIISYESDHSFIANINSNQCGTGSRSSPPDVFGLYVVDSINDTSKTSSHIGSFLYNNGYLGTNPWGPDTSGICNGSYCYYTDPTGKHFQLSAQLEKPSTQDLVTTTSGTLPNWSECPYGNYRIVGSL